MPIRGVLFDIDGPLLIESTRTVRSGVENLIRRLHDRAIVVGAMSTKGDPPTRLAGSGLAVDGVKTGTKGSGDMVQAFCSSFDLAPHECLTVVDDEYGFREAINGRTIAFHAEWGGGSSKYGIRLEAPNELIEYLDIFFLKQSLWFGCLDTSDGEGRRVALRALIDGNGAGSQALKSMLYTTLKDRNDVDVVRGASLSSFLMTHLFASAYLEGLFSSDRDQIFWQIYPASSPNSHPPPIIQSTISKFKLFRSRSSYKNASGLCRYTQATQSHKARLANARGSVNFTNQMNSILLTPEAKKSVSNKRVYVIDDFTTEGYSLEAARNMFYAAGAREVYSLAFGKYGFRYAVQTPQVDVKIVTTKATKYAETDFYSVERNLKTDANALDEFKESMKRLESASIRSKLLEASPDLEK